MGYSEPELQESDAAILAALMERSGLGLSFSSLAERGSIWVPEAPALQFADGVFATPSGRIEIASARAEADGHPRLPQASSDPRPAAGHLRLLSPAHVWLMNTSFGNVQQIERRIGEATIALHPADAAERHLAEGDLAVVRNHCGRLSLKVVVSDQMPCGVALTHKGRWLGADAAGANVNALNPGEKSDMGESTAVHSVEVSVSAR
jgi:anaerobic selenocysteine-containing dehydrogenase